jgi:nucleotidyltransferase substrate binding protein (TIGR01987 family)
MTSMTPSPDVRWKQRLQSYRRALSQLVAGTTLAEERQLSNLERQGLIQAFEFTHELAWNVMKDFLAAHGSTTLIYGSKDATRAAFAAELLENADQWMEMIGDRNRTSHTYNESTADEITGRILDSYIQCLERFEQTMTEKEREES